MKNTIKHSIGIIVILLSILTIVGSYTEKNATSRKSGLIKLTPRLDDIFTKPILKEYLNSTTTPTIVLRVPDQSTDILEESKYSNSQIYNTIEKEFAKSGFVVRDRALFQKVIGQNAVSDYSKIKELTDTDLILEFVNLNTEDKYLTNKYIDNKGKEKTIDGQFVIYGYKVEFKLISVDKNDIVGMYTFYYTPCTNGCHYSFDESGNIYSDQDKGKTITLPYEFVTNDTLVEFFQQISKKLINELK